MKRAFDVAIALAGLVVTAPVVALAALAIKLDSPGPVFYGGRRVGRGGEVFTIHKLRTMHAGAELNGPAVTAAGDPRITRVGRILRRTKVDELPQLLNVIRGEMSVVGPRPEAPEYVAHYSVEQRRLLDVAPGITGPATLDFIDEEQELADRDVAASYLSDVMPRKLAVELRYLESRSLAGDLAIVLRTAALLATRPLRRFRPRGATPARRSRPGSRRRRRGPNAQG